MKKEMIQTRNRKMNKKMIIKNETLEEDWTNNDDWLKSYNFNRSNDGEIMFQGQLSGDIKESENPDDSSIDELEEDIDEFEEVSTENKVLDDELTDTEKDGAIP